MSSPPVVRPIPDAILWHDGMLLTPEHFLELEARAEAMLEQLAASLPFHWGVSRLALDAAQLTQGKVIFLELEAVLPDGFAVRIERKDNPPVLLDLNALDPALRKQPFFLYLAVVAPNPELTSGRMTRYVETPGAVVLEEAEDEEDASETPPIPRLQPRFQLLAAVDPPSSKFVSMPLVRVGMRNETWVALEDYQPPVRVLPQGDLLNRVGEMLRRVREIAIVQNTRWGKMSAAEREEADASQREAWRALVAELPAAEAMLGAGSVQPFALYLALCALAGRAAGLTEEAVPPLFSPYRHGDIAASFAPVLQYLNGVLGRESASAFAGFPFRYEREVFSITFSPEWAGGRLLLAMRGPRDAEAATRSWGESSLVGARTLQDGMRARRVLGAARTFASAERGLSVAPGVVLFVLSEDSEFLLPGEVLDIASGPRAEASRQPLEITMYVREGA